MSRFFINMPQLVYTVPTQYRGKSLSQLRGEQNLAFRPDTLANFAGIGENDALGETLNVNLPDSYVQSGEAGGLRSLFGEGMTPTESFAQKQRARESDFLGRFKTAIPEARTAIESELGLPGLRTNALQAGETARNVQNQFGAVAPTQQTVAKQVGISAPRLQQRISTKTAELAPALSAAASGLSGANEALSLGTQTYNTRMSETLKPLETEAGMLSDSLAREFTGFSQNVQNELNLSLEKIRQSGAKDVAEIQKAQALAEKEQEYLSQRELINLGGSQALINPSTGQTIQTYQNTVKPTTGTLASGW